MKSFQDCKGRSWDVTITVATIKRVRSLAGVDLMEAIDGEIIDRMGADPVLLVNVLYAVCKPQADAAMLNDEDFGESMAGDAIEHATAALIEALIDFFPNARDRAALREVYQAAMEVTETTRKIRDERISQGVIKEAVQEVLRKSGVTSTNSPAPLALTRRD